MIKEELNSMFVNLHTWGETLFSFPSMTNCEVVQVSLATWHTWKGSRSTQEPRKPLFRPLTRVSSSIQSKVRCAECDTWHTCPVCPGPHSTPGKDLDRLRSQENLYLDPWHVAHVSSVSRATWHTWKGSRSTQEPRKPLSRPLTHLYRSILSKDRFSRCAK